MEKEDRRIEVRKEILGDILWSYASDQDEIRHQGAIIDESESGLSILTLDPIKVNSTLRIYCKGLVRVRCALVIWCKKVATDIYQSGLLISDNSGSSH